MINLKNFWYSHTGFIIRHRLCYVFFGMSLMSPIALHNLISIDPLGLLLLSGNVIASAGIPLLWALQQDIEWCLFWISKLENIDRKLIQALKVIVNYQKSAYAPVCAALSTIRQFLADRGEL